jgi:DNA-binding winged helix-turn-helix (wHTH) protein
MRVQFGSCLFDSETRELRRDGGIVPLSPKAFELLRALLEERPRAVPKSTLRDRIWSSTIVSDTSLARVVNEVRTAIGDDSRLPRFVRTVHGFGYAFSGETDVATAAGQGPADAHACELLWGERALVLAPGENLVGRGSEALVSIPSRKVSRRHARILLRHGRAMLEDLGSKNGTFVGGCRIEGPVALADGDQITVGPVVLVFREVAPGGSTETAGIP